MLFTVRLAQRVLTGLNAVFVREWDVVKVVSVALKSLKFSQENLRLNRQKLPSTIKALTWSKVKHVINKGVYKYV